MNHLEDELKHALRREEPSPDFTARVLERVLAETQPANVVELPVRQPARASWRRELSAAAAIAVVAMGAAWMTFSGGNPGAGQAGSRYSIGDIMLPGPEPGGNGGDAPGTGTQAPAIPRSQGTHRKIRTLAAPRDVPSEPTPEEIHAAEQLSLALKITSDKLSTVQERVKKNLSEPRS